MFQDIPNHHILYRLETGWRWMTYELENTYWTLQREQFYQNIMSGVNPVDNRTKSERNRDEISRLNHGWSLIFRPISQPFKGLVIVLDLDNTLFLGLSFLGLFSPCLDRVRKGELPRNSLRNSKYQFSNFDVLHL